MKKIEAKLVNVQFNPKAERWLLMTPCAEYIDAGDVTILGDGLRLDSNMDSLNLVSKEGDVIMCRQDNFKTVCEVVKNVS